MKRKPGQLDLFEFNPVIQIEEPPKIDEESFNVDVLMEWLDRTTKTAQQELDELTKMLEYVQRGMTEDEKLQIRNPKEYYRQQELKKQQETIMAKELTLEAVETLKNSTVEGLVVKLPAGQLDRNIYIEVKNRLELIGGKWKGGKVSGFVFGEDPTELLAEISNGGSRNLKKEFQFFETPEKLADRLVKYADPKVTDVILEPSAGQGAIVKAIHRALTISTIVFGYELMPLNQKILSKLPSFRLMGEDFMSVEADEYRYDKIVANPPFSKNQDVAHIRKMYSLLKDKGRLVSIASNHWRRSSNKTETEFRFWLYDLGAQIIDIDAGEFKESGTIVSTCVIIIDKK